MAPDAVADEAEKLARGFTRGEAPPRLSDARPRISPRCAAVRRRIPDTTIMVDYNQALTVAEALRRGAALDQEGIYWLEEPIRHDDYAGAAQSCPRAQDAGPDRREFLAPRRHGDGDGGRRLRLCHAGSGTHRRRHRVAARRRARRGASHRDVVPPVPRGQRPSAGGDLDRPLARMGRLGRGDRRASRCGSSTDTRFRPTGPETGSSGTPRRSNAIGCKHWDCGTARLAEVDANQSASSTFPLQTTGFPMDTERPSPRYSGYRRLGPVRGPGRP